MKLMTPLFLVFLINSPWLNAAPILDQNTIIDFGASNSEIGSAAGSSFNGYFRRAQTFTAGIEGNLSKIVLDFDLDQPGTPPVYSISILQTDATGIPTDNILATVNSFSLSGNLATFDFLSSNLYLKLNSVYAFEVVGGLIRANNSLVPGSPVAALYSGGGDYFKNSDFGINDWASNATADLRFQTYMTPIPLSASIVFFGPALFGLFTSRKFAVKAK
jgi:hypothetical protein